MDSAPKADPKYRIAALVQQYVEANVNQGWVGLLAVLEWAKARGTINESELQELLDSNPEHSIFYWD